MTTEDLSRRPERRTMQKERERERRRMRDRQRRQSMSLEEREKHLARRRRNYQLRRQKAGNTQMGSKHEQTSIVSGGEQTKRNENRALIAVSELSVQCVGVGHGGFSKGHEKLKAAGTMFEGAEARAHKSSKYPRRLCLNQIRQLARLLNTSVDEPSGSGSQQIGADVIAKENVVINSSWRPWFRSIKKKSTVNSCETSCTSITFYHGKDC